MCIAPGERSEPGETEALLKISLVPEGGEATISLRLAMVMPIGPLRGPCYLWMDFLLPPGFLSVTRGYANYALFKGIRHPT
jgi:hypothetical protein